MAEPLDLLDSRHYEAVRLPAADAAPLPNWCYTSENWYRLEVERIFRKVWVYVGHASRISEAGDFFTVDVAGAPVIVLSPRFVNAIKDDFVRDYLLPCLCDDISALGALVCAWPGRPIGCARCRSSASSKSPTQRRYSPRV